MKAVIFIAEHWWIFGVVSAVFAALFALAGLLKLALHLQGVQ